MVEERGGESAQMFFHISPSSFPRTHFRCFQFEKPETEQRRRLTLWSPKSFFVIQSTPRINMGNGGQSFALFSPSLLPIELFFVFLSFPLFTQQQANPGPL